MLKRSVSSLVVLLFLPVGAHAGTDPRALLFCDLAAKHFAAFLPPAPARKVDSGLCILGSLSAGQVKLYFPLLGTDSLDRERIVTGAIGGKLQVRDEPDLGERAFSVRNPDGIPDSQAGRLYFIEYYARKNAQIFGLTFTRPRPFSSSDEAAARAAFKAFMDDLD
jgi:hypothetical protein